LDVGGDGGPDGETGSGGDGWLDSGVDYRKYLPPILSKDFYPNGLTRQNLLERLPEAVQRTGRIGSDEVWKGAYLVTGDVIIETGASVTIEPGTIVFVSARSDDQQSGPEQPIDEFNPKDPPYIGSERTAIDVQEIFGTYKAYTEPASFVMAGICPFTFVYNTLTGSSPLAIGHAGNWSLRHNNFIPTFAGDDGKMTCVKAYHHVSEQSDLCQVKFLEEIGGVPMVPVFSVPNNYWGTVDPAQVEDCLYPGPDGQEYDYLPFETGFVVEALPDWHEFEWN
jgi:hypothetical protein